MRTFRCKQCKEKKPSDSELITYGVARFCSKSCRLAFTRDKKRKEKDLEKQKKKNARESVSMLTKKLD